MHRRDISDVDRLCIRTTSAASDEANELALGTDDDSARVPGRSEGAKVLEVVRQDGDVDGLESAGGVVSARFGREWIEAADGCAGSVDDERGVGGGAGEDALEVEEAAVDGVGEFGFPGLVHHGHELARGDIEA